MSKVIAVLLALVLIYLRLLRRKREADRVCPGCGERNPRHLTHCRRCMALL